MRSALIGAVLVMSACTGGSEEVTEPHQKLPYVEDGNFQLYVSNQSFEIDPVDIEVKLGGVPAVAGDFPVEGQHSWHLFKFDFPVGSLRLDARSEVGDAELTQSIELGDTRYAVLDFWYYPDDPDHPRMFSLYVYDEPPLFD